jgi:hypothetical protein
VLAWRLKPRSRVEKEQINGERGFVMVATSAEVVCLPRLRRSKTAGGVLLFCIGTCTLADGTQFVDPAGPCPGGDRPAGRPV